MYTPDNIGGRTQSKAPQEAALNRFFSDYLRTYGPFNTRRRSGDVIAKHESTNQADVSERRIVSK